MPRAVFRQQIDEGILDQAAGLFARRGFGKTSVQDVADAVVKRLGQGERVLRLADRRAELA